MISNQIRPHWLADRSLRFAVGVEDTFIPQARPGRRALDEYELMQHDRFWAEDLGHIAEVGASMVRWGIPWYRVNPAPGVYDFRWLDQVVDRLDELGLDLIADLVHYGTPLWLDNQFLNEDYPTLVADFAGAVADRYRGRIRHYTPLNEPLLNIMYCGEFGYWPPELIGDDGFVKLLRQIARGIVLTQAAIATSDPGADFVHVEASFRFAGDVADHRETVEHLRHRAFLVEDLVTGSVDSGHPLAGWLARHGFSDADFTWFQQNTAIPTVMGVNYYPQHSTELFEKDARHSGGPADLRPRLNDWTRGLKELLPAWAARYAVPVFLTETCFTGSVPDRIRWLDDSLETVRALRADGLDVVGYTWWCITDMVEWSYRTGAGRPLDYQLEMGLWSLEEDSTGALARVRTLVADRFQAQVEIERAIAAGPSGSGQKEDSR